MLECFAEHRELFPTAVKPIGKLIAVAAQMLYRDFVIRPIQTALEQGKRILNRVGMNRADSIGAAVIDRFVLAVEGMLEQERVYRMLIGVDRFHVRADMLL